MSKLWLHGIPIQIKLLQTTPVAFVWNKKQHYVTSILRQWRLNQGWWEHQIWRDYYQLTTDTRLLVEIYHDLIHDTWALQRLYD